MSLSKPEELLAHELSCPICLQLFSDPVVLPCGHNYCLACIRMTADSTDDAPPRCPECRDEYQGVETLKRNFKLCSIIEGYRAAAAAAETNNASRETHIKTPSTIRNIPLDLINLVKKRQILLSRFMQIEPKLREVATGAFPSGVPSKAPLNPKRLQAGLKTQDFRSEMTRHLDSLHILLNPLELTFNLCTAHPNLLVSSDQRTVKYSPVKQTYPDHSERFTSAPQILCTQGFSGGEHVWVVEVGGSSMWSMGVCYKSIPRRGDHSRLGHNSVSWRLQWKNGKLTVCQSSCNVALGEMSHHPLRVEVALDYEAGTLMFHNVRGRREHLHTFRAVFREPLYPSTEYLWNVVCFPLCFLYV
uniref:Tripartite motif containing 107 n=1 Tax=Gasterosteus aculeatus aculeatus TaxID=481459 RepID=G3NLT6_GASAC